MLRKIIITSLCLLPTLAFTFVQNNFLTPIGGIEGISANTGVARRGSVGAVIYNPAGMAYINTNKVSVSGSAFSQNWVDVNLSGNSKRIEYFQTTPSQITTVYHRGKINLAFSLLVPKVSKFKTSFDLGSLKSEINYEDQETYAGPSISYRFSEKLSLGLSVFGIKRDFSKNELTYVQDGDIFAERFFSLGITGISIVGNFGISYTPIEKLHLGLNIQSPKVNLNSSFESKVYTTATNNSTTTNSREGDASFTGPAEISIGAAYKLKEKFTLLTDVGYQFSDFALLVEKDANNGRAFYDYKNSYRAHVALEYDKSKRESYSLGFTYNRKNEINSLDFIGATIGYRLKEEVADSMIGLFINKSLNETINDIETNYLMAGVYLSSSINFME